LVNNFLKENIASATGDGNGSFRAHKKSLAKRQEIDYA
jgi:hypothetical protein